MTRMRTFVTLVAVVVAAPAVGHENGSRALGIVENVSAERIVVETADGHPVAFTITKDTRFVRGDEPIRLEDVKPGQRVVVHGKRLGEELQAVRVKVGAPATKK